jgi:hypothetical protein
MRGKTLQRLKLQRRGFKLVEWGQLSDCPVVSGPDLAKFLDITEQRVRQLTKKGMLKVGRGQYPLLGCLWWYLSYCRGNFRARRRSKKKEFINRQKSQMLYYKTELLRIRLNRVSDEFVVKTLLEGRKILLRSFDAQYRRMAAKFGLEFDWSKEQIRYFETVMDQFREEFVSETETFFMGRVDRP